MTTLYHELLTLTVEGSPIPNHEGAAQSIRIASNLYTPAEFRKEMRDKTVHFIMPTRPDEMEYSKDCFWRQFQQKFVWHKAWMGTLEQRESAAEWLRKERETAQRRGNAWPPVPMFRPMVLMPEPWDGKEEKPGRIPRTGKE